MGNKRYRKKRNVGAAIIIVALLVVVAFAGNSAGWFDGMGDDVQGLSILPAAECSTETTPLLTIKSVDTDNKNTVLTETTNLYRKEGDTAWTAFTMGTGFAASPNTKYEIIEGIGLTDWTDNAYGSSYTYLVPCEETPSFDVELYNDEIETSLSAVFYNEDANAAAQTVLAADTPVVSIKLRAGADEYFGNPTLDNPNVLVLTLNSSQWDIPQKVVVNGQTLSSVSLPQRHTATASFKDYAFELPAVSDEKIEVFLYLDADDTNAPAVDGTASIYAGGYFLQKDAEVGIGVENEEGTAVGTDAADTVVLDFTA